MNIAAHAFATPERLAEMRNDIAARRKARQVNLGVLAGQHGATLRALARRHADMSARTAVERLVAAGARHEAWTPATGRDLRAAVRGLSAAAGRLGAAPIAADALAWHLDRLRELLAQDSRIAALEAALEAHWPAGLRTLGVREGAATGKRAG